MVLAVGTFATRKIPTSTAHGDYCSAAAARAEEEDKEEEAAKNDADGTNARFHQYLDNAAESTAHSSTHASLSAVLRGERASRGGFVRHVGAEVVRDLPGPTVPVPRRLTFCFVPPALPVSMDLRLPAMLGAGGHDSLDG